MPIHSKFAGSVRLDQPSCVRGGISSVDKATVPWWRRLVACLTPACACLDDKVPSRTFPWHDLPTDVTELIVAKVPLLRLAQLAHLSKEFQAAYRNHKAAQLALPDWLGHVTADRELNSFYTAATKGLDYWRQPLNAHTKHERGPLRLVGPCSGISLSPTWTVDGLRLSYDVHVCTSRNNPLRVTVGLECSLKDVKTLKSFSIRAKMGCLLEEWSTSVLMVCKSLALICLSECPYLATPSLPIFLMLSVAIAPSLRRLLHEVAAKLCYGRQPLQAMPIKSVTLVLPEGRQVPDKAEEAAMCDAITSVLAIVGGKPSRAEVAIREGLKYHVVNSWRLPCVLKRW